MQPAVAGVAGPVQNEVVPAELPASGGVAGSGVPLVLTFTMLCSCVQQLFNLLCLNVHQRCMENTYAVCCWLRSHMKGWPVADLLHFGGESTDWEFGGVPISWSCRASDCFHIWCPLLLIACMVMQPAVAGASVPMGGLDLPAEPPAVGDAADIDAPLVLTLDHSVLKRPTTPDYVPATAASDDVMVLQVPAPDLSLARKPPCSGL